MSTESCVFVPTAENYVMIASFSVIFCLSVIGNAIVVLVILQQKSMRSITNLYLLNLAISDLLLSVVCMPPTLVSSLVYCWVFGDILCKLLAYLQPVVVTASAYTLAAIALERYYAICKPLHSRVWHTKSHACAVIGLVWLVSVIANFFMLFMYELRTYNETGLNCAPRHEPIVHFGYQIYMTMVLLVIPLVIMTGLYASVIRTLKMGIKMDISAIDVDANAKWDSMASNSCRISASNGQNSHSTTNKSKTPWISLRGDSNVNGCSRKNSSSIYAEQRVRSTHSGRVAVAKQRLIRMLIVIVIIFFCCWTPSYIWWLLLTAQDSFGTFNVWNSELNTFITVLTYLSSCTNPITYCFLNSKFRNALFLSFGCKRGVRPHFHRVYNPAARNVAGNQNSTNDEYSNSFVNQTKNNTRSMSLTFSVLSKLKNAFNGDDCQETHNATVVKAPTNDQIADATVSSDIMVANGKHELLHLLGTETNC
uniref:G-protein coupled receptors family 1 profile domain-containing protein n=2 Tax=Acrobeloides nanus TaxID=290746 RepID=A0A914CCZ5_9BILA